MQMHGEIADRYRDFAAYARGDSPTFEAWALGRAEDPEMHAWLADLPEAKQQPNLVFAAARWHGAAAPGSYAGLRGRPARPRRPPSRPPSASARPRPTRSAGWRR